MDWEAELGFGAGQLQGLALLDARRIQSSIVQTPCQIPFVGEMI